MNATVGLPLFPAGERMPVGEDVLWYHGALCRLALPVRAPGKGVWRREAAGAAMQMEASEGTTLPSGRFARLLLMAICDAAYRGASPVVELGETPAELARRLGLELSSSRLHELADQLQRLLAAKLSLAWDGGPTLSVFDARGRARVPSEGWRSSVRMTARLRASLAENAVALRRKVVLALSESLLALDLYAWLEFALPGDGAELTVACKELQAQFGQASQNAEDFAAALAGALEQLRAAWPVIEAASRGEAVYFRRAAVLAPAPEQQAAPEAPVLADEPDEPVLPEIEPSDEGELDLEAMLNAEAQARASAALPPSAFPPVVASPPVQELVQEPAPVPEPEFESASEPRRPLRQSVSLKSHLTGLPQVVWLQRANGREIPVIEITPGGRYDPDLCTVIALEPVALQIWGGLYARDFERVAAWAAANRDLIDDFWESRISDFDEVQERVRKVPAPAWR